MLSAFLRVSLLLLLLGAAPLAQAQRERLTPEEIEIVEKKWPGTKKTSTGIRYLVLKQGTGATPKPGDRVGVLYTGMLLDGKKFDEQLNPQRPLLIHVDREEVISGWDQVLQLMKVGEKRIAIIPGSLAYGSRGKAPVIPRDATLVFEMELVSINPPH